MLSDEQAISFIRELQESYGNSLGYRKMADRLKDGYGVELGRRKVLSLMEKAETLSCVRRKHFSEEYYLTRRQMKDTAPPDLIERDFFSMEPRIRFVCDITYLTGCDETWYLNSILDLFNGEIVAWSIGEHCDTPLCTKTLEMLKAEIIETDGIIVHSDGGSTYNAYAYRELCSFYGIRQSMGVKMTCYDNARMESFNAVFKTECLYARYGKSAVKNRRILVRELAARAEEFIPYYNGKRRKDGLNHMTPVEYRMENPRGTYPALFEKRFDKGENETYTITVTHMGAVGGADKKLDFSMILDQDSGDTQEDFSLPRTF